MRVGKKFYFDGVGGESAGGQLAKRGNEGQLLESLFGTRLGSSALLHSDRLNINCPKTEKRRVQGGSSDPEHRTAAGTFLAIEKAVPISVSATLVSQELALFVSLRIWRWSV